MDILLQEFNFTINTMLGKSHANVNFLSRVSEKFNFESLDDSLYDAQLFNANIIPSKYAEVILNYKVEMLYCL